MSSEDDWSEPLPATPEIQELADKVKLQLEKEVGKTYPVFEAKKYRVKCLLGACYYIIKVCICICNCNCIGGCVCLCVEIVVRVDPGLENYQLNKTLDDLLEPF